jgi:hypothetical protein
VLALRGRPGDNANRGLIVGSSDVAACGDRLAWPRQRWPKGPPADLRRIFEWRASAPIDASILFPNGGTAPPRGASAIVLLIWPAVELPRPSSFAGQRTPSAAAKIETCRSICCPSEPAGSLKLANHCPFGRSNIFGRSRVSSVVQTFIGKGATDGAVATLGVYGSPPPTPMPHEHSRTPIFCIGIAPLGRLVRLRRSLRPRRIGRGRVPTKQSRPNRVATLPFESGRCVRRPRPRPARDQTRAVREENGINQDLRRSAMS